MSDLYILRDGEPIREPDLLTWGRWIEQADDERRVARTEIGSLVVSTVFLGLDHRFGDGPPLLYETMVFGADDDHQERYTTREEAEAGHARIVQEIEAGA